LYNMFIRECTR